MSRILLLGLVAVVTACANPVNRATYDRYTAQGGAAEARGDWSTAEMAYYRAAVNVRLGHLGPADESTALYNLGRAKREMGKLSESEDLLKQGLAVDEKLYGVDGFYTSHTISALAGTYYREEKYDQGIPLLLRLEPLIAKYFTQYTAQQRRYVQQLYEVYADAPVREQEVEKFRRVAESFDAKTDVNAKAGDDVTALMTASENGRLEAVQALLAAKADVNAKANNGYTALMLASLNGHREVVQALLAAKANMNAKANSGRTALIQASQNGHWEVVQTLLAAKADVNVKANNGRTALMAASLNGHLKAVQALLTAGANANAETNDGDTALMLASKHGRLEVAQALLAAGVDVNAKTNNGYTALILASQNGHLEVVQALLAAKADVNAKADEGVTALIQASQNNHPEVVQALLVTKADVNAKRDDGVTALTMASQQGHLEVVQALLAAKVDVNATTDKGDTALMLASLYGHREVVQLLKNAGGKEIKDAQRISMDSLPLELAMKSVKGNGKRKLVVFSDPNCTYCKRLEKELINVTDVTIYTLLYPVLNGSVAMATSIWCSPDRLKAWDDFMLKGVAPARKYCETPIAALLQAGQKNDIRGTPTLIFADDSVVPRMIPADTIEKKLNAAIAK